jgi:hypothetical protein
MSKTQVTFLVRAPLNQVPSRTTPPNTKTVKATTIVPARNRRSNFSASAFPRAHSGVAVSRS